MRTPTKKAALYSRCSTDIQRDKGFTIPRQKQWLEEEAKRHGFTQWEHYTDDGISATAYRRPEYERMMEDIESDTINAVIVYKLDRAERSVSRTILLIDSLNKRKVDFISICEKFDTTTPFGKLLLIFIAALAQWERDTVVQRVSDAMWHKARKGDFCGGQPPYGYDVKNKNLVINEKEADAIKDIFEHFIETKSFRSVCHRMNSRGYKTKRGQTFASSTVRRLLTNPVYMGYQTFGKRIGGSKTLSPESEWLKVKARHAPIISEEIFNHVQAVIRQKEFRAFNRTRRDYLLTGILRCGECGGTMHGYHHPPRGKGDGWYYYKCHNNCSKGRAVCLGNTHKMSEVDEAVLKALIEHSKLRLNPEQMKQAANSDKKNNPIIELQKDIKKEKEKQKRIYETRADGTTPKHLYEEQMRLSIKRLERLELRLVEITDEKKPKIVQKKKNLFDRVYSLQEGFFDLTNKEKHEMVSELIKSVSPTRNNGIKIEFYGV